MRSVWFALRAECRRRWRPILGMALLLGLVGGVAVSAAAGARRTDTAFPRLLAWSRASQHMIVTPIDNPRFYAALRRLPHVESVSAIGFYNVQLPAPHGQPGAPVQVTAALDRSYGVNSDHAKVLAGRTFDPLAAGEAMIDQQLARRDHLRPGGTLRLTVIPQDARGNAEYGREVTVSFTVTAIVLFDDQVVPNSLTSAEPAALVSEPFAATSLARSASYGYAAGVRLRPGASWRGFSRAAGLISRQYEPATGKLFDVISQSGDAVATQRAISPDAAALAIFAALAAVIGLAVVSQLLGRQILLDAADFPVLSALGMTRRALGIVALSRAAVATILGGLLATALTIALSPVMPIGAARLAEPSPGAEVNLAVLGIGLAAIVLAPLLVLTPIAWRSAGWGQAGQAFRRATGRSDSGLMASLGLAGPLTAMLGVRMAFHRGRGRAAVPVRSALLGTSLAVLSVVAALVFGASFVRLIQTPARYGQDWSDQLDLGFGALPRSALIGLMSAEHGVAAYAGGNYGQLRVDGLPTAAIGIDPIRGGGFLSLLAGHSPRSSSGIVLGAATMRSLRVHLGDRVLVGLGSATPRPMRVVGEAVFPSFSRGSFAPTDLGSGAAVASSLLAEQFRQTGCVSGVTCYNFLLIRYRPGFGQDAMASLARAVTRAGCPPGSCTVLSDQQPREITNYAGIRDTPLALGCLLAVLAAGTLAHVLLTSVRRRRRDLALFKTLGLRRGQIVRVVSWQATALGAAALAAGLPLGIVAGRWSWALFAGSIGVGPDADIPMPLVFLAIPVVLVLANLLAIGPGWASARIRPALTLRAE
jgi:ABC-type antimicrobial peptide transport system permease subunit